jgi:hypothetical protein
LKQTKQEDKKMRLQKTLIGITQLVVQNKVIQIGYKKNHWFIFSMDNKGRAIGLPCYVEGSLKDAISFINNQ